MFVALGTHQSPLKSSESENTSMPWTSLKGMFTTSSNRLIGTSVKSTRRVCMLRTGMCEAFGAAGVSTTALVAATAAAASTYAREAACTAAPLHHDRQ